MNSDSWSNYSRKDIRYGTIANIALRDGRHMLAKYEGRPMRGHDYVIAWWCEDGEAVDAGDVCRYLLLTEGHGIKPWNVKREWIHGEKEPWTIGEIRAGGRCVMD